MSVIINNFNKSNVTRIRSIYLSSCHTSPRRKFGVKREKISIAPKRRSRQSDRFEDIVRSFEGAKKKRKDFLENGCFGSTIELDTASTYESFISVSIRFDA